VNYRELPEHRRPEGAPGRIALSIAGNDQRSKQIMMLLVDIVMRLVDELGFDPVDAGSDRPKRC
jgi:predicted dinucleotide-binding enzyme